MYSKIARGLLLLAIVAVYVLQKTGAVTELIFWLVLIGFVLIAIVDYYWLGGKLNGWNARYGKK